MQGIAVGVRIDRDRGHSEPPRSLHDATGDFTPIGDE
jgi:hypothetical protein